MGAPRGRVRTTHVTKKALAERVELDAELAEKRDSAALKFDAKMLARTYTREAVGTLAEVMLNPKAAAADRITAAKILLERGHGRAPGADEGDGGIKMPVVFLPVELDSERRTITIDVPAAPVEPQFQLQKFEKKPAHQWNREPDEDDLEP